MNKKLEFLLVSVIVIFLLMTDFITLGQGIALAIYEELENQNVTTNVRNVGFDAYFMLDGQKVHSKENSIDLEETLILNISVKDKGVLNDAKIKIENSNFKIINNKMQNNLIKNINVDSNEIELNQIVYQNDVNIEIPIQFKKEETFDEDYFERENTISLTGVYKDENEQNVTGKICTKIIWKQPTDVTLSSQIKKYLNLGENGILLQQDVTTEVQDDKLPRENEKLILEVPTLNETIPESVVVLLNGEKLAQEKIRYSTETKKIEISYESKGTWGIANNEYKVIYKYNNDIEFANQTITLNTSMVSKLYTQEDIEKKDEQTVEIRPMGNVVSITKSATDSLYKGFMYAGVTNETNFDETSQIEISSINSLESVELQTEAENFVNDEGEMFDVSKNILDKMTIINRNNFIQILGETGEIQIKDASDQVIEIISASTQADESGNIIVSYPNETNNIKIVTSKPIQEGNLIIKNAKAIKGKTGYTKDQLKTFTQLITKTKVKTNVAEEIAQAIVNLNDTKTEAKLEINNSNLSTLQANENIQLMVTLKSDSFEYDLYKNPKVEIIFPKELQVNVKSITQINKQEELTVVNPKTYVNENKEKVISLQMQGEQLSFENNINQGVQIAIIADVQIDKATPSKDIQVIMNYTNENRGQEVFTTKLPIQLNSKYGVLTVNKLSNYNSNGDYIEKVDSGKVNAQLDTMSNKIIATQTVSIINNYETDLTNVSILGTIPNIREEEIDGEVLKSNFVTYLKNQISCKGEIAKIYYTEDIDINNANWNEEIQDISKVKAFKIELLNNKLKTGNVINLEYNIEIPANLEENKNSYSNLLLSYDYSGETYTTVSTIVLQTNTTNVEEKNQEDNEYIDIENGLKFKINASTAEGIVKDNQDVVEGAKIKYKITLVNNSDKYMNNVKADVTYNKAVLWDHVRYNVLNSHTAEEETVTKYEEYSKLEKLTFEIGSLEAKETKEIEYQISVKEVDNDNETLVGNMKIYADELEEKEVEIGSNKIKQGDLNLKLIDSFYEQTNIHSKGGFPIELQIKNMSKETKKNIIVSLPLTDEIYFTLDEFRETDNVKFIDYKDKIVRFEIKEIAPEVTETFSTQLIVEDIPIDKVETFTTISFNVEENNKKYYSNEISRKFYQSQANIIANQISDKKDEYVDNGDKIIFTTTIENKGAISANLDFYDDVPDGAVIKNAYLLTDGNKTELNKVEGYNVIDTSIEIEPNQKIQLIIETEINTDYIFESTITNYATIKGYCVDIKTDPITYKVKGKEDIDTGNGDKTQSESDKSTISGLAWLDSNKNGYIDESEEKLQNIEVLLIDSNTGNIAQNDKGEQLKTTTNKDGVYSFDNLKQGKYIVVFKYDSNKYGVTEYQSKQSSEDKNSDVISKKVNLEGVEQVVAMTGTIELKDFDINNIDAGFIENEKFDLKLDKYVSSIIMQDKTGTTKRQYDNAQLAKIELNSKYMSNTTVVIEYKIQITNEGELAGYVNELIDYIPKDLTFSSEMNKNWYQLTDGNLYSKELLNQVINPGESKTVTLTLTKTMNQNNTGTIINTAEINSAMNDFSIEDIDSTPGNKVNNEDDISTAQVIISIKTGAVILYTSLAVVIVSIIGIGIYLIKKKVNIEE